MFPSMQLGGEKKMIEQAQVGALQFARVSTGPVGTVVDNLNVFNLPFVFRDTNAHARGDRRPDRRSSCSRKSATIRESGHDRPVPGWIAARAASTTRCAVKSIADLKGLKIRMMGNPMFVETMNALGGNGVPMSMDQVMSAMQTGVVDGAENNPPSYDSFGHVLGRQALHADRASDHPGNLVFSRKSFDAMSKEDQALILKFAKESQLEQRKLWDETHQGRDGQDQGRRRERHHASPTRSPSRTR